MATEVVMPQMGESIAEGTITRWLKKVGETVERDEPLFEISTDKVDAEIPSPAAGTLTQVLFKEGDTVEVNKVVAYIGEAGEASDAPAPASAPSEEAPKQDAAAASAAPASQAAVSAPPPPPPAPTPAAPQTPTPPAPQQRAAAPQPSGGNTVTEVSGQPQATSGAPPADGTHGARTAEELRRTRSSPLVRKIAAEHNIDISRLEGTGASGRVTKNDILSYIESGAALSPEQAAVQPQAEARAPQQAPQPPPPPAAQPGEGDRVEPMSVMRKKIAEHMTMSQRTSAHVATVYEIDMTRVHRLREAKKAEFQQRVGTKLSYMPFIFQAVTQAIRRFPVFNSQVAGDQIIYKRDINLGMAVALDWGLIVPVIKRADDLSIAGLAKAANDLADRARAKQLKPDEVAGGTFTITNPGVFGGLFGTPIINQPQVAILGVGTIEKRAKVVTTEDGEDVIAVRHMAYFALSFDHRIIDGADAERFLSYVKEILEAGQFLI
ncbi:MAG: 2-oxoglutarate dehydrogenase, E2 component, dihydrolipoamide succinyltransferase [Acidobacteria bacterium]|nr:2-oxoglutarate dehydrogenase, E2 component, dihydrolipoamide succinyltransferase [Acidobacteriota bacterium]